MQASPIPLEADGVNGKNGDLTARLIEAINIAIADDRMANTDEHMQLCADIGWQLWFREERSFEYVVSRAARRHRMDKNEVRSEAWQRMPQIVATWRPGSASLRSHAVSNLRWYLHKLGCFSVGGTVHAGRIAATKRRHVSIDASGGSDSDNDAYIRLPPVRERIVEDTVCRDEVQCILSALSPYQRSLLQMHFMAELTYEQMADVLETTRSNIGKHVREALRNARRNATSDRALDVLLELRACLRN